MKKLISVLSFFILSLGCVRNPAYGQLKSDKINVSELIKQETDSIFEKLIQARRRLHENPELAGKERQTQEFIKRYLLDLGLEVKTDIYGYGVVGILKGSKKGKKIAWRADMDALASDFADNVAFKSTIKGVQHGCGHDVHMAIALGIAEVLAKQKKSLHGTAYFIFQPEEETFKGAKGIIESDLFSTIKPDEMYGLHVTALPVGEIMVKRNEIFAYQRRVQIALTNTLPNDEIATLTKKIEHSLFRTQPNSKPWEIRSIVDPATGLANPNTIFKDYRINENFDHYSKNDTLFIEANLYETNLEYLKNIIPAIRQVINSNGYKDQLLSVSMIRENPTVMNDPKLTNISVQILDSAFGKKFVTADYGQVPFFNDDFAYFQQKIRGVYFLLGGSNFEQGVVAMNHAPDFKVDEECIRIGVRAFATLILERLK
ncbi:MAG: M20 family metallopeptidase [Ferruginibacter sp.]